MRVVLRLGLPEWKRHSPRPQVTIDRANSNLREQVCAFIRPAHLPLLGHAQTHHLVDRRLRNTAADRQSLVMPAGIVDQSGVVADVAGCLVQVPAAVKLVVA